ncbi:sugar phosphate isomerase/epimerase [candidate division KSB1 bacterium]|nr:sugar phosphate isomerase/epimerase [candidate division KSB1 bacterium]
MNHLNRRNFFKLAAAGTAAAALSTTINACQKHEGTLTKKDGLLRLKLGIASYTFRHFNLDDTIAMTKRLGITHIALKSFHLPLESADSEIAATAKKVRNSGLELYGCGVIYMKKEDDVHRAFDYAKAASVKVIIGVPEYELLELVNQKVKEYDIKAAIHNHGPGDKIYPSAESIYERVKDMDPRMGLCIDIGHSKRLNADLSDDFIRFFDRVHDIHFKDVTSASAAGTTIETGRGVVDVPKALKTLLDLKYQGIVSLEFAKDEEDPLPGVAESLGYIKGVLSVI